MSLELFVCCDTPGVRVEATGRIVHLCPHVDEVDEGTVTVAWTTTTHTVELHALRAYLDEWAGTRISHEHLVEGIRADLLSMSPITDVTVTAAFTTARLSVGVTSAVPGDRLDTTGA
jgi:NADPH-dependent 7-cyano-7-deazaguanine reductase QueF